MKLIIDIPDDVIENKSYSNYFGCLSPKLLECIENGTPIKDGDLISRSALKKEFEKVYPLASNEMGGVVNKRIYDIIDNVLTVYPICEDKACKYRANERPQTDICPNCDAQMVIKEEHEDG